MTAAPGLPGGRAPARAAPPAFTVWIEGGAPQISAGPHLDPMTINTFALLMAQMLEPGRRYTLSLAPAGKGPE